MNDLFLYLAKVSAGLAIIFLPYYFLFRNDPNLVIKRFYLLIGIIASWVFPFITFRKLPLAMDLTPTVFIDLDAPAAQAVQLESTGASAGLSINWLQILIFIYLAGFIFMFLKNLFIIFKWNFTWLRNHDEHGVAYIKNDQVFTLFTRIFIPASLKEEEDLDNVLLHEKAHIQQLHFIDLMLMEFTLLLTWFNPFSWLISRMIKENHEHLADRQVLSAGINPARYKAQLMNHTLGVNVFRLGTQFNHSLTLKRFKMMKKPRKSPLGILKIALLIPAVLITLGLTTGMTPQQKTVKGKVILADTGEPVPGASIVIRNGTTGTVSDIDGTFMLNVDGDPELVISFVGYKTLSVKSSKIGKKPLELEVETYSLDLEPVSIKVKGEPSGTVIIRQKDGSDAQPVFVVDGEVVKELDKLDPESIESVSVFKDSDSEEVKKYKAKDGVVVITTKKAAAVSDEKEELPKYIAITHKDGSDAQPVFVLDGEVVKEIDNLDSESIESVSVYKDSESEVVKKYNAKNGVVMITTKEAAKASKENEMESFEKDEEVFYIVEDMPKFPGGMSALSAYIFSNLEYPDNAGDKEGEVILQWKINTKGQVEDVKVLQSTNSAFDAPAIKVIQQMPEWKPGKQRGKPVSVYFSTKIPFTKDKK
jgi:TonB family protein